MKIRHLPIVALMLILISWGVVHAVVVEVSVDCVAWNEECRESMDPDPVTVAVGDQVRWVIDGQCAWADNYTGLCSIEVPAIGFSGTTGAPGSLTTPPFAKAGTYHYTVACSPSTHGTIIVISNYPTLSQWGLIIFGVVLLGFITWVFLKRRRVVGVRV
jgi:plastocyanin